MFRPLCRHAVGQLNTPARSAIRKRCLHAPVTFDWTDPLNAKSLFTEEELAISETAESYCQERMLPRVLGMYKPNLNENQLL
jgi:glutaryl-CoA dehydrogenase